MSSDFNARSDYDVFFSHSTSLEPDRHELLDQLVFLLESRGYSIFLDRRVLKSGQALIPRIEDAIRRSRVGVIVITRRAMASGWVALEIEEMVKRWLGRRMPIFGLRMEDGCPAPPVPKTLEIYELRDHADLAPAARRIGEIVREAG